MATSLFAAPVYIPKFRAFTAAGVPLAAGKLYSYTAGTSTPLSTYPTQADALAGTNANANPVVLDANGEANVFGQATPYKFILQDSASVVQWTEDNVYVGLATASPAVTEWTKETGTIVYVSATSFKVSATDVTAIYHAGRMVKTTNTGGTVYSRVSSSSFATDTTVTVVNTSGTLDSGISAVYYGILSYTSPSYFAPRTLVSVVKNGDQTAIGAAAKITAWTEELDSLSEYATPTFTCKYPGNYLIALSAEMLDTGTNVVMTLSIYKNGSEVARTINRSSPSASQIWGYHVHHVCTLAATDTIEVYVTGTTTTVKGTIGTRLSIHALP